MDAKLKCILLIDDNEANNNLSEIIINDIGCAETVISKQTAVEALDYLQSIKNPGNSQRPDLILLDINMPLMNGWEFMEEYNEMDETIRGNSVVVMLSTSLNPDDEKRSKTICGISEFANKPLTEDRLNMILHKYFLNQNAA